MINHLNSLFAQAFSSFFAIKNTKNTKNLRSLKSVFLSLAVCLGLIACAAAPLPTVPPALQAAQRLEQRAAQAFAQGDFPVAQADYQTAAEVYASLALVEPQMRVLLSLARVQSEDGQTALALQTVNRVLAQPWLSTDTHLLALGRGGALLLARDNAAAQTYVQQALTLCAKTCSQQSALLVLQSRVALQQGHADQAIVLANDALKSIAATGLPLSTTEQANALHMRALAALSLQQPRAAADDAQAALALDQSLGIAARVVDDLRVLVDAYRALGDTVQTRRQQALLDVAVAARLALRSRAP